MAGYIVRARRADAWDAIVTLLVALDAEHGNYFHAVMQGCRRLSNSRPEIDGLDDLLLAPEQHLHEVAIERERRRSQQGYATPADARAFLQMARQPTTRSSVDDGIDQGQSDRHGLFPSGERSAGIVERDCAVTGTRTGTAVIEIAVRVDVVAVRSGTLERRPHARDRRARIARSGDGAPDRGRRDAGASARAARSRGRRPAGRQAHALAAADGVRSRHGRDRLPDAQSRARVPREHAARGMLGPVATVHAAGSVRCCRGDLQSGTRVLARALAERDLAGCASPHPHDTANHLAPAQALRQVAELLQHRARHGYTARLDC